MKRWISSRLALSRRIMRVGTPRSLVQSFNYAFEGVIHTLATQRNMRIHFSVATVALIACVVLGVTDTEFMLVVFAASFVIAAEMFNTAVEAAIDVSTTSFNPLAKIAKDVAAGAVLIATFNALVVGFIVFSSKVHGPSTRVLERVRDTPVDITFIAMVLTFLAVIALKVVSGRAGTPLRGGFPSGHAAIAFASWMAVTFVTAGSSYGALTSALTFLLALLVVQTRVESGVHTWFEVFAGALLGALVTLVIFQLAHHVG